MNNTLVPHWAWLAILLASCGGGDGNNELQDGGPTSGPFVIGGTVTGLSGTGLVLQNGGGDDLAITANGAFAFSTPLAPLTHYLVTVKSQPSAPSQTCTVSNASGTAGATPVTDVAIACTTNAYTVGGDVEGLSGAGLVLQNNAGDDLLERGRQLRLGPLHGGRHRVGS